MIRYISLFLLLVLPSFLLADVKYEIKRGDTLWGISKRFYKNPLKWPVIWKYNTYITNPDLIYPKKFVMIPYKKGVSKKDEELSAEINLAAFERLSSAEEFFFENAIVLKEEQDSLKSLGLVSPVIELKKVDEKFESIKRVLKLYKDSQFEMVYEEPIGAEVVSVAEGKFNAADGDTVYVVSDKVFSEGDKVIFLEPVKTGDRFTVYTTVGEGFIVRKSENRYQVKVQKVYDAVRKGLKVVGLIKNDFPIPVDFVKTDLNREGYVIGLQNNMSISGGGYKIVANVGKNNGIKPGDIFKIYRYVEEGGFKNRVFIGEAAVVFTQDRYANLYVISNTQEIIEGDHIKLDMVAIQ